jgi:formylglycine-generating enzyme required for sulfatase activity
MMPKMYNETRMAGKISCDVVYVALAALIVASFAACAIAEEDAWVLHASRICIEAGDQEFAKLTEDQQHAFFFRAPVQMFGKMKVRQITTIVAEFTDRPTYWNACAQVSADGFLGVLVTGQMAKSIYQYAKIQAANPVERWPESADKLASGIVGFEDLGSLDPGSEKDVADIFARRMFGAILAHEYAHIYLGHLGASLRAKGLSSDSSVDTINAELRKLEYERGLEVEADRHAMMNTLKVDTSWGFGMIYFYDLMDRVEQQSGQADSPLWSKDHPGARSRVKNLMEQFDRGCDLRPKTLVGQWFRRKYLEGEQTAISEKTKNASPAIVQVNSGAIASKTIDLGDGTKMKFVFVPPGEFIMGSSSDDPDKRIYECPQHLVKISKGFYMGIYEVTQEQYQGVMGDNPSHFRGDNLPVEMISWNDASKYCEKLSVKEGQTYRLPTEAEWEYACRAKTTTRFYYGDDLSYSQLEDYSWYRANSSATTHPVGEKKPNVFGLYDMSGNVYEWCSDRSDDNYYANSPANDPQGPSGVGSRVMRGGHYMSDACCCRSTERMGCGPNQKGWDKGFRVVMDFQSPP